MQYFPNRLWSLALGLLLMAPFWQSCVRDQCKQNMSYFSYAPVYMSATEFRAAIKVESPRELNQAGKIYKIGDILLINEVGKGIHIYDNANPKQPIAMSFLAVPGSYDMTYACDKLFVDSSVDLLVFDMADASQPRLINRLVNVLPNTLEHRGFQADPSQGYVVAWERTLVEVELEECDGSIPLVWQMNQVDPNTITLEDANTRIINPGTTGTGGSMSRFAVLDNYLYTVAPTTLQVFDITNCAVPTITQTIDLFLPNRGEAEMVSTLNDLLLVGSTTGVSIYRTDASGQPSFLSIFEHVVSCDPVVGQGNYAYVTLRDGDDDPCGQSFANQLDVLDLSDPAFPNLVRSFGMYNPHGLSIDQNKLFIADGAAGLKVFDATEPETVGNQLIQHFEQYDGYDIIADQGLLMMVGDDGVAQYRYNTQSNQLQWLSTISVSQK